MDIEKLQRKLMTAARTQPLSDAVPYAFEQRIMARLRRVDPGSVWRSWATVFWRAAAPCGIIAILLGLWTLTSMSGGTLSDSLDAELETTVCAAMDRSPESW
jgi:hypothetical protein